MNAEGPYLESLTRRLSECPSEFLREPVGFAGTGEILVSAVVNDLIQDLGGKALAEVTLRQFGLTAKSGKKEINHLKVILIGCWLLHDSWFIQKRAFAAQVLDFLGSRLEPLASMMPALQFVSDPDRREELARICLKELGLRPRGETLSQAQDRLVSLDSVERTKLVREARAAEERAKQIREAMAKKAAEEAAASYGRE